MLWLLLVFDLALVAGVLALARRMKHIHEAMPPPWWGAHARPPSPGLVHLRERPPFDYERDA
jgi:hypothetical protein